jgi:hypothetical protein
MDKSQQHSFMNYSHQWKNIHDKANNIDDMISIVDLMFDPEDWHEEKSVDIYQNENLITIRSIDEERKSWRNSRSFITKEFIKENNFDAIIELGSGPGWNIFHYLEKDYLKECKLISGEFTQNGCNCQNLIKSKYYKDSDLEIYSFDYNNSSKFFDMLKNKTFNNILVFSIHSIEQITYLKDEFIINLLNCCPKIKCINVEPIGWQISNKAVSKETINGYRSYYNKNYYSLLKKFEQNNKLIIKDIKLNYYGYVSAGNIGTFIEWDKI